MLGDLAHNATFQQADLLTMEHEDFVRFMRNVDIPDPLGQGCWLWLRTEARCEHGFFYAAGVEMGAYRHSYEHFRGRIPAGLVPDHLCRHPPCVNPWHLEPVTQAENARRAKRHPPSPARAVALARLRAKALEREARFAVASRPEVFLFEIARPLHPTLNANTPARRRPSVEDLWYPRGRLGG